MKSWLRRRIWMCCLVGACLGQLLVVMKLEATPAVTVNGCTTVVRAPGSGMSGTGGAGPFGPGVGLSNGDFAAGLSDWVASESGGSLSPGQVSVLMEQAQLEEGDSFLVTLEQTFIVPVAPSTISFELILTPGFDQSASFIPDAFEATLLNASSLPVVEPWTQLATSFFNVQEDGSVNTGSTTIWNGTTATVDISMLAPGDVVTLYFDYVNGDPDTAGGVRVDNVVLVDGFPDGSFLRGDLDGSGLADSADLSGVLAYLWSGGAAPVDCGGVDFPEAADVNDNEFVTIADYLELRRLLDGGLLPPEPSAACAVDPTSDTGGFDVADPTFVVTVGDVTVNPPMASIDREVFLDILVDTPVDMTGFTIALEFPEPTLLPFDPGQGDPTPFESVLGTTDFLVEPGRIVVGGWATNPGDILLAGNSGTLQLLGQVRFRLADFAILPPLAWNPQPSLTEPTLRATIVDAMFADHHPTFFTGPVQFARGNSNDDSNVDIADPVFTLAYLFNMGPAPVCFDAADANNDSNVDIADAAFTLNFLFAQGTEIPPPYPGCGSDVGPIDTLPCDPNFCM